MARIALRTEQDSLEAVLVQRAHAGDRHAFDQLASRYRPLLFALAFLRTSHVDEAEILVQEVLIQAWQKLPSLKDAALFLPWLKSVMANACITWYRRASTQSISLDHESTRELTTNRGLPLQVLLEQDRERQLRQALLSLPETNRLALLMHVSDGASYEDIAILTGVPASTIDGRIYRAKRQMRRLLYDAGAEFLGETMRLWRPDPAFDEHPRQRRKPMPSRKSTTPANDSEQPQNLILFTRRFSLMLDAGVPLNRALEMLQAMPAPYGEAAVNLRAAVERGDSLATAMSEKPLLFPPAYVGMIRAGEQGGVLEETVQRLKKVLTREWSLAKSHPTQESPFFLLLPAGKSVPENWEEMSAYQQTVTLSLFFETFGTMLLSGVPIVLAMKTVADLLPKGSQEGWARTVAIVLTGELFSPEMTRMGIFPEYAVEMIRMGEEAGTLDSMMHSLAESFEDDLEYQELPSAS